MSRIVLCVLVALASAGCELYAAPVRGEFERTLTVTGPVDLDIRTGSGGIRIDTGPANTVKVVARIRVSGWLDEAEAQKRIQQIQAKPPILQSGNTIRIGRIGDDAPYRDVSIGYDVTVPESTTVRATAGSGGQRIRHVRGPVTVATGSGGIRVEDALGEVHATAGSGGIRLTGVRAPVVARVGSGGISLSVADDIGFEVDARTGSGGIATPRALTPIETVSRHRVHGTVRGGGPRLDLSTGSGGIHVE